MYGDRKSGHFETTRTLCSTAMPAQMSPEFASLQLILVERFVQLGLGTLSDGVHQLTNFQRRLGIGTPTDPSTNQMWIELLEKLNTVSTHVERVETVMSTFSSLPPTVPEHIARGWPTVGAFSVEISGTVAHTHFYAMDNDDKSPLHPSKLNIRRNELQAVLAAARKNHPELDRVIGGSWLYTTSSYASLFPAEHVTNAVVRRGRKTFRGMSHWGQFLDHRWNLRTDLAEQFRYRVENWTGDDPCSLFPIDTLEVSSPITVFDSPDRPPIVQ
jgi:hypothetical protein